MGFKYGKRYRLTFDDPDLEGLQVMCRGASVEDLTAIEAASKLPMGEAVMTMIDRFVAAVVSWNIENDEAPLLPTREALLAQDADLVMAMVMAWADAVAGVAGPLGQRSTDGEPSQEASLPMEPLSPSPPS